MKTILVTGSNKGIGLEFARQYLNEGFKVIATCRNLSKLDGLNGLVNSFPDKISIYQMELLDEKSIEDFSLEIKDTPIDIFINNAGVAGMNTTVSEYPLEEWNKVINLNLNAVFYCCKAVVPFMVKNDYGRIVNIASIPNISFLITA